MPRAAMTITDGDEAGKRAEFDHRLAIGRHPENGLQVMNRRCSRFHAEVVRRDGSYWIRDLDSRSGTFVAGKRATDIKLVSGDQVSIGEVTLRFELLQAETEPPRRKKRTTVSFDVGEVAEGAMAELDAQAETFEPTQAELEVSGRLRNLARRYEMLYKATQMVSSDVPQDEMYAEILQQLFAVVSADRGLILVTEPASGEQRPVAARARDAEMEVSHVEVSRTILDRTLEQRVTILTSDAMSDEQFARGDSIFAQNIRSVICAPLLCKDEVLGAIYLDTQTAPFAFDQEALQLVTAIASSAALAVKNSIYIEELKQKSREIADSYLNTIKVIANAIEARDKYTLGHAWRVTRFALALAEHLDWDEERRAVLEQGGLLHDVGKVGVGDAILCKNGRLTDEEFHMMRLHPQIGARILKDVPFLERAIPCVACHHERWDGKGYPEGLAGEAIPEEGRLLAIADTFDAMTSNRVYRKGLPPEQAAAEILKCAGTQFDPTMAEAFVEVHRQGKVDYILQNKALEDARHVLCPVCSTHISLAERQSVGARLECPICKQKCRIMWRDDGYVAELVS